MLGAARGAAGDLEHAGAELAEHAGERPALGVIGDAGRVAGANIDNCRLYEAREPVVGSHCPGLAGTPYYVHRHGTRLE